MPWTKEKQAQAEMDTMTFAGEFHVAYELLKEKISTGASDDEVMALFIAVSEVLRRWRAHSDSLQTEVMDPAYLDELQRNLVELGDQRGILARLESEAGTRTDQAASVNPKVTQSPYTNILGLQRIFRAETRTGLLVAGIVFAVLAVAGLAFLVVRFVMGGISAPLQTGGSSGSGIKVSRGGT
jgi:hypothetical protein